MARKPDLNAEEAAAKNIQGKTISRGKAHVPESTTKAVEIAEDILGVHCTEPNSDERTDRAFIGWEDGPRVYARVHDASVEQLEELAQYGFEKHKQGHYLWRNDGPFDTYDHVDDDLAAQGEAWSTESWSGE